MAKASTKPKKATKEKTKKVAAPSKKEKAPVKTPAKVEVKAKPKAEARAKVALTKENEKKPEKKAVKELTVKATEAAAPVAPVVEATEEVGPQADSTPAELKTLYKKISQAGNNWENVHKLASKVLKAKSYKMSDKFEAKTPIQHKVLGWGYILSCENNRIQVLFKDGVKTLITNYTK